MKKILCIFFACSLMLSLSSCKPKREYSADKYTVSERFEMKTEKDTYPADVSQINYTITNISDQGTGYDEDIYLSKLVDDEWKIVFDKEEIWFTDIATMLPPKTSHAERYVLQDYFKSSLEPGQYRLVKPGIAKSNIFTIE